MELLKEVRISNFRSLRNVSLLGLTSYSPLIGLNSTGKSNVLRALNLYFNDELDELATPLALDRDYPRSLKKSRQRKAVTVGAVFDLTTGYEPRNTTDYLALKGLTDQIAIQREWSLSPLGAGSLQDVLRVGPSLDSLSDVDLADRPLIFTFIRSVHFRYVPNHVRPADFLRTEVQPLRKALLMNLRRTKVYKDAGVAAAMSGLSDVAKNMLSDTSRKVSVGNLGREISADLPAEFTDLAFQIALQTVTPSGLEPTELQGSGTQSFTLLHVLDLLDRTERGQQFGWKKASIWAIEEPESFLHAGLRARFAQDLADYAGDDKRQIIASTHHEEFVRVGSCAWLAEINDGQTRVTKMDARDALGEASRRRITVFQHPLIEYPDHPMVIVEGKFDGVYLRDALARHGTLRPRWKLVVMSELDTAYRPGGSALGTYLSANKAVINSRALTAPVLILRDWEDAGGKLDAYANPLSGHDSSTVLCCPKTMCNPQLGTTFRGIERYLPTDLVTKTLPSSHLSRPAKSEYPIDLNQNGKDTYTNHKSRLAAAVTDGTSSGAAMRTLVEWLDGEVVKVLEGVPVQMFL